MRAFSLVELSIVLVILGLLTGGILAGQSLIRASELRSITTEYNQYVSATQTFRNKYMALPGDMRNAIDFWQAAHNTPATCATTVGVGTQTCNGDGNGQISNPTGSNERFRFWQHLANAGLISGTYSGVAGSAGPIDHNGINTPSSRLNRAVWGASFASIAEDAATRFVVADANYMHLGATSNGNTRPRGAIIKPEEAWGIDTKIDDGRPGYGSVLAVQITTCTNAANNTDRGAQYLLTSSATACALDFVNPF